MLLSRGRNLLGPVRRCGVRNTTGYVSPKFQGGKAKPNEFGLTLRQLFYEHGERTFSFIVFPICALLVIAGIFVPSLRVKDHYDPDRQREHDGLLLAGIYPYPTRKE